jgi:hypothetical protein
MVLTPESLTSRVRTATSEDFLCAVKGANQAGVEILASLFPEWVAEIVRGQRKPESQDLDED